MPSFDIHKKWHQKYGLSEEVVQYIENSIDSRSLEGMPQDFEKHNRERKIPRSKGNKTAIADLIQDFHDRGKRDCNESIWIMIKEYDLKFLLDNKTKDYVEGYYLHFVLDYLNDTKDWRDNTGESIEDCLKKYRKNKASVFEETEESFNKVINFVQKNIPEIRNDLE